MTAFNSLTSILKSKNSSNGSTPSPLFTESKLNKVLSAGDDDIRKVLVTPTIAKELLERNVHNNRRLKAARYKYAQSMKAGKWKHDTYELIKITPDGEIIDGQNRLHAVVIANTPIMFRIAFNVPSDVFDVLDTGCNRNASDVFHIAKIKNDNTIPSIIQFYASLVLGAPNASKNKSSKLDNSELLSEYNLNEVFWQEVARKTGVWYTSFAKILPPSFIGGFYAFLQNINKDDAERFMNQVCTGVGIESSVVTLLRSTLMKDKMAPRKMSSLLRMAIVIKTWNAFRAKKEMKILKVDFEREGFPKAI